MLLKESTNQKPTFANRPLQSSDFTKFLFNYNLECNDTNLAGQISKINLIHFKSGRMHTLHTGKKTLGSKEVDFEYIFEITGVNTLTPDQVLTAYDVLSGEVAAVYECNYQEELQYPECSFVEMNIEGEVYLLPVIPKQAPNDPIKSHKFDRTGLHAMPNIFQYHTSEVKEDKTLVEESMIFNLQLRYDNYQLAEYLYADFGLVHLNHPSGRKRIIDTHGHRHLSDCLNGEYSGFVEALLEDTEVSIVEMNDHEPLTVADLLSGETTVSYYAGGDSDSATPVYCHLTFKVGNEMLHIPAYVD